MQELVISHKDLEDLRASRAGDRQSVWSFLGQAGVALASIGFSPIRGGDVAPEPASYFPF
jgi:hypothetical protein